MKIRTEKLVYKYHKNGSITMSLKKKVIGKIIVSEYDEPSPFINNLDIQKGYRSKGLGAILMNIVLSRLTNKTAVSLYVLSTNYRAIRFYEKFGFFVVCTNNSKRGKFYMMSKRLLP